MTISSRRRGRTATERRHLTTGVAWTSSDADDGNDMGASGLATGVAVGTTNITAASGGVTSPGVTLTVTAAALQSLRSRGRQFDREGKTDAFTATGTTVTATQNLTTSVTWTRRNRRRQRSIVEWRSDGSGSGNEQHHGGIRRVNEPE